MRWMTSPVSGGVGGDNERPSNAYYQISNSFSFSSDVSEHYRRQFERAFDMNA